jgi:hypothetical protein
MAMPTLLRKRIAHAAILAVLAWLAGSAHADYEPLPLPELFAGSDLIALGTIAEVRDTIFELGDFEVLFGPATEGPALPVERFRDWSGNARWSRYRPGQRVLLFLARPRETASGATPPWRIRGAGGEGEMPVEDGHVYLQGLFLEGFERQTFAVQQGRLQGYRFALDDFLAALNGYNRCFRAGEAGGERRTCLRPVCDAQALQLYRAHSPLQRYLVDKSRLPRALPFQDMDSTPTRDAPTSE